MKINRLALALCSLFFLLPTITIAQNRSLDKADADALVYEQLANNTGGEHFIRNIELNKKILTSTAENNVKLLKGNSFQINSLTSDVYIDYSKKKPLYDQRYPLESMVNTLMNVVDNSYLLKITHNQYGNVKKTFTIPLHSIFYVLDANMDSYCSVTKIDKDLIQAILVFHNPRKNYIHMFLLDIPSDQMFKDKGVFSAKLYTNIPQEDVKSIIRTSK